MNKFAYITEQNKILADWMFPGGNGPVLSTEYRMCTVISMVGTLLEMVRNQPSTAAAQMACIYLELDALANESENPLRSCFTNLTAPEIDSFKDLNEMLEGDLVSDSSVAGLCLRVGSSAGLMCSSINCKLTGSSYLISSGSFRYDIARLIIDLLYLAKKLDIDFEKALMETFNNLAVEFRATVRLEENPVHQSIRKKKC